MIGSQITLTKAEVERLRILSQCTGKSEDELIREAFDLLAVQAIQFERQFRLATLRKGRGIWRDREDLPDLTKLRAEWDRD